MADLINPLVAQYLSGLGADLMKYGGDTSKGLQLDNVNTITQQNIKSNNMLRLMQEALSPDGSSVSLNKDGVNIKATPDSKLFNMLTEGSKLATPKDKSLNTESTPTPQPSSQEPITAPTASTVTPTQTKGSFLAGLNPANLAGMTGEDILNIVKMKQAQDQIALQTQSNITDQLYKKALTRQANATADETMPSVPIIVGGKKMLVTPKDAIAWAKVEKETTPTEQKLYNLAREQGFEGSIIDFKNTDLTGHQKDYNAAVKGGYKGNFNSWLLQQANAGRTIISLDTKLNEKKALSELGGQLYFNDPKWTEDINKQLTDFDKNQAWLIPDKDKPLAKSKVIVKTIEDKITAGSGDIQNVAMDKDGKTMIWTVKWPSGDTKTIKYVVK